MKKNRISDSVFSVSHFPFCIFFVYYLAEKGGKLMKHCPSCKTDYADDTLQFCLQDGTRLAPVSNAAAPPVVFDDTEAQTVIRNKPPEPARFDAPNLQTRNWESQSRAANLPPPKSGTAKAVLLTILVMLLLFGGGLGAWFFLDSRRAAINENTNFSPSPTKLPVNKNTDATPSPTAANGSSNANAKTPTPTPDFDAEEVKAEVSAKMDEWKDSMESGSLDDVMSHYADTLDYYYRSSGVSSNFVRNNKQGAFDKYYRFRITMSEMRITPDASGRKATVVFNKAWEFEGSGDRSAGTVRSQFQLSKIGDGWYITGEKDL